MAAMRRRSMLADCLSSQRGPAAEQTVAPPYHHAPQGPGDGPCPMRRAVHGTRLLAALIFLACNWVLLW
eukprot:COSAG01_NODE_63343_length_280_cov_0.861878_1_plen_68_part_01